MRIVVRSAGNIGKYLPPGTKAGEATLTLSPEATLSTLLNQLPLPGDRSYLISVNDTLVRADSYAAYRLNDGDKVTLMPPLKGG